MPDSTIYIVVSAAFQDAGDTSRAIALATAVQQHCPVSQAVKIDFLLCGSIFEPLIRKAGFNIVPCQPRVKGVSVADDLGWDFPEFFGSASIAQTFIEGQLEALRTLRPDAVLHGMWPPASLAARLLGIRTISFLPLPMDPASFANGLIRDLPDAIPLLSLLPRPGRKWLAQYFSRFMVYAPIFRQHRLGASAEACGWPSKGPLSLFDIAKADLNLVNDLPDFHADYSSLIPSNIVITGPLFARVHQTADLDPKIEAHLRCKGGHSIFVTMGSSGTKEFLFEAVRALTMSPNDNWNAVVLAAPAICSLAEVHAIACGDPRLLVIDQFIPAPIAAGLADITVCHGGQGTVQTAMAAGTPIVGVALQVEQQTNLDNVMDRGAGIRIQRQRWCAANIRRAVKVVLANPTYKTCAIDLSKRMQAKNNAGTAADHIWKFLLSYKYYDT